VLFELLDILRDSFGELSQSWLQLDLSALSNGAEGVYW
jgi:hypothetical protein